MKVKNTRRPTKILTCSACGDSTQGRQWWNRDTGFGCCPRCFAEAERSGREEAERLFGRAGEHHSVNDSPSAIDDSQKS